MRAQSESCRQTVDRQLVYFDVVDLLAYLWKNKRWIMTGAAIGIAFGAVVLPRMWPTEYNTKVVVEVHMNSGDLVTFQETFQLFVTRPSVRDNLKENYKQIEFVGPLGVTRTQSSVEVFVPSYNNDWPIEVSKSVVKSALDQFNQSLRAFMIKPDRKLQENLLLDVSREASFEAAKVQVKLYQIEKQYLFRNDRERKTVNFGGNDGEISSYLMRGIARSNLKSDEADDVIKKYADLNAELTLVNARYRNTISELIDAVGRERVSTKNESWVDGAKTARVIENDMLRIRKSRLTVLIIYSCLVGVLLGIFANLTFSFFVLNRERLKEAIKSRGSRA